MKLIKQTIIACAVAFSTSASATMIKLQTDVDGTLLGASGVLVGKNLYDVRFGDGVIGNSITSFTTLADAKLASEALLNQVLLGDYDTLVKNANGCSDTFLCTVVTPYAISISPLIFVSTADNYQSFNRTDNWTTFVTDDTALTSRTIAYWSPISQISAVPIPASFSLMFTGLGLLGVVARHRKQKEADIIAVS